MAALDELIGDRYTREARILPALLAISPAFLTLFVWMPSLRQFVPGLVAFLSFVGVVTLLSHIARRAGAAIEDRLFEKRAQLPTAVLLRHDDSVVRSDARLKDFALSDTEKETYHKYLNELAQQLSLPHLSLPKDREDEARDLSKAPSRYNAAIDWLREATRDSKKFGLVLEENISYGFTRNLRGLRPVALWCGGLSLLVTVLVVAYIGLVQGATPPAEGLVAVGLLAAYLAVISATATDAAVKNAGYVYARQLLRSLHAVAREKGKTPDKAET